MTEWVVVLDAHFADDDPLPGTFTEADAKLIAETLTARGPRKWIAVPRSWLAKLPE